MRNVIVTENAPQAIGPYSVAIQTESLVFCSGQLGLDPATGDFSAADVAGQTRQALTNLKHVLEAAGSSLEKVVKTTVFLRDMADFPKMNAVYAEFFSANPPARSAIAAAALPKGGLVEIEAIAQR
ncbi:MAG: RidA family protein [Anaerolineales bacterium]